MDYGRASLKITNTQVVPKSVQLEIGGSAIQTVKIPRPSSMGRRIIPAGSRVQNP